MNKRLSSIWGVWVCIALAAVIGLLYNERVREEKFTRTDILPLANFIEGFRSTNQRLPTVGEFKEWSEQHYPNQATWYYPVKPSFVHDWGRAGHDFVVGKWRGEYIHYFCSWNRRALKGDGPTVENAESEEQQH